MRHIFALYPGGAAGAGLLLLRLHATLFLVEVAETGLPLLVLATSILIAVIAIGLFARVAALLSVAMLGMSLIGGLAMAPTVIASQMCSLIALFLMGPGAFSIDARRFGRKVIRLL